jgi:hypothetical protein
MWFYDTTRGKSHDSQRVRSTRGRLITIDFIGSTH